MRRTPKEVREEIIRLYKEGYTVEAIATMTGVGYVTVYKILHKSGTEDFVEARKNEYIAYLKKTITSMIKNGASCLEIAAKLDLSEASVRSYVKRYGLSFCDIKMEEEKQKIVFFLQNGYSYQEIADELGLSVSGVIYKVKKAGIDAKKERKHYRDKLKKVKE